MTGKIRPMIVRFVTRHKKYERYKAKRKLKNKAVYKKVYIEDLTNMRYTLLRRARREGGSCGPSCHK